MPEPTQLYITLPNGTYVRLVATTLDPSNVDASFTEEPAHTAELIEAVQILGKSFGKIRTTRPKI